MNNYIPFLKFKVNEIGGINTLSVAVKAKTYPFFDLPRRETNSEEKFLDMLDKCAKSIKKNLKDVPGFFLDNLDIDDNLTIAGRDNYDAVIDAVGGFREFIPVVGLDRTPQRNDAVFDRKVVGGIVSEIVAIRLQHSEFQSFAAIEDELLEIYEKCLEFFKHVVLVLDNRLCLNIDPADRAKAINRFLKKSGPTMPFHLVVVTGSSIPASARELLTVQSEKHHQRTEIHIYRLVAAEKEHSNISLGDYTIVSPNYSDLEIPDEAMQNVIAAKAIYSYGDLHYIVRGGSLKNHPRGRLQYNDIAASISKKPFYRGKAYSFGDNYIDEKANGIGKGVTPGSILKPTINLHITYMLTSFPG